MRMSDGQRRMEWEQRSEEENNIHRRPCRQQWSRPCAASLNRPPEALMRDHHVEEEQPPFAARKSSVPVKPPGQSRPGPKPTTEPPTDEKTPAALTPGHDRPSGSMAPRYQAPDSKPRHTIGRGGHQHHGCDHLRRKVAATPPPLRRLPPPARLKALLDTDLG